MLPTVAPEEQHASLFVPRLAHALHASGYAAHSLEDVLKHICDRLGLIGQFYTTPTAIVASFGTLETQRTHLIRVASSTSVGSLRSTRLPRASRMAN